MNRFLLLPLGVALAQAPPGGGSGYDYEYYDPVTGATISPAAPRPTTVTAAGTIGASPAIGAIPAATSISTIGATPAYTATSFPATTTFPTSTVAYSTPAVATTTYPGVATTTYGVATTTLPAVATTTIPASTVATSFPGGAITSTATPYGGAAVSRTAAAAALSSNPQIAALRAQAEQQQQQHKRNARIVKRAQNDQREQTLFDTVLFPGPGHSPAFAALRLGNQKRTANALLSEKRIAVQNAQQAYQRYQQSPTQLNLLISKYADLNADLRDAAHHFNVVNSGTFGQAMNTGLFGLGGGTFAISYITQSRERDELNDIQRQMKRVGTQIQSLARSSGALPQASTSAAAAAQAGSVQQRLVAMGNYGPQGGPGYRG